MAHRPLLRNLLIDVTGNTHRSEFCIDKLYSPDGPPAVSACSSCARLRKCRPTRMSAGSAAPCCVVSWSLSKRHKPDRLKRWELILHDRFMLPHFVRQDFDDVIGDLQGHGLEFKPNGCAALWNSASRRSAICGPRYRRRTASGVLEPWHVMGEGRRHRRHGAHFVDSSVERLQVRATGMSMTAPCSRLQRPRGAATAHRLPSGGSSPWRAPTVLAAAVCLHPTVRRSRAAHLRSWMVDAAAPRGLSVPRLPAGRAQLCHLRSTAFRGRRPVGWRASSASAIHRGGLAPPAEERFPDFPSRWTYGGPLGLGGATQSAPTAPRQPFRHGASCSRPPARIIPAPMLKAVV